MGAYIMPIKFKEDIERIFFEGTILDIDFSHFREYISFIVASEWGCVGEDIFPWREFYSVKFMGVDSLATSYDVNADQLAYEGNEANASIGILVHGISIERHKEGLCLAIIESSGLHIEISFKHHEIILLSKAAIKFAKMMRGDTNSFVRLSLEEMASMFYNKKGNNK
jgi:hypothetical protein